MAKRGRKAGVKAKIGTDAPPPEPKVRFFVLNLDCDNYEGEFNTMEKALEDIAERHEGDGDDVVVLEVVAQYSVSRKAVANAIPLNARASVDERDW